MILQVGLLAFCGALCITLVTRTFLARPSRRCLTALMPQGAARPCEPECPRRSPFEVPDFPQVGIDQPKNVVPEKGVEVLLFRAEVFTPQGRRCYLIARLLSPVILGLVAGILVVWFDLGNVWIGSCLGGVLGFQLPRSFLKYRIKQRDDEILFHLPLVVEQMVLGVCSSLDIGPCMKWIVEMADERDSHNSVTRQLALVQQYMKSGVSIDESLREVALLCGNNELKHVFMALSRVVRHGGEVAKQLHEVANAVAAQHEVAIEERIKGLEIRATAPVALIFMAFLGTFLTGLGIQLFSSFK